MIEVLVSDLGNVVLPFDFSQRGELFRQRLGRPPGWDPIPALAALHDEMGLSVGGATAAEYYAAAQEIVGPDLPYDEFRRIISHVFWEDPAAAEAIRTARVAERHLLSNTDPVHWDWIVREHGTFLSFFDRLNTSFELRAFKPDLAIYRATERITGRPPAAHLLVDDLEANVAGARAAGWDAIHFTDAGALRRELAVRGLSG